MVNRKYEDVPFTFEKGLVTEIEESVLDIGQAASLVNWEPATYGGLRTRNSWSGISTNGLPAPYKIRGWGSIATSASDAVVASITQSAFSAVSGSVNVATSKTATLNGVIAGSVLVAVVSSATTAAEPTVSGYTSRLHYAPGTFEADGITIFTKTSTSGGTEVATATHTNPDVFHIALYEVVGTTTEAPVVTDTGEGSGLDTLSATGGTGSGVAISCWVNQQSTPGWTDHPADAGWTTGADVGEISPPGGHTTQISRTFTSTPVTTTGDPAVGDTSIQVLALWDAGTPAATPAGFYIVVAIATNTGYSLYRIPRNEILTGTWQFVDSEVSSDTNAFVSMGVGTGELVWTASTMDNPRYVVLSTLTGADVTDLATLAGRTVAYHKDRMFVGGSTDNPSRLYFSGIGTPHTFTTATDFLDIGGDDGEAIEDLISVEGLLLVCKVNRLYLISGSGVESFFVNELPGGTASTGRPAIRTPYGTIVAGPRDIWVVQGGGVDPMSRPLGVGYAITGLVSTAYAQDTVLICDSGTNQIYRVNLITGAWSNETVSAGEHTPFHLFSLQGRMYYGVSNSTTSVGGTRQLSSLRTYDSLTGTLDLEASTGRAALFGPHFRYTPRHLFLQLRNHDITKPNELFVTVETNLGSREFSYFVTEETQRIYQSIGWAKGIEWVKLYFSCDASNTHGAIDVEKAVLSVGTEDY